MALMIKLEDLRFLAQQERIRMLNGGSMSDNSPQWLKNYLRPEPVLVKVKAKRKTPNGRR